MALITADQKRVIDETLSLFETSHMRGVEAYSTVALLGDKAGISYGLHQSTDRSDSLDDVLWRYLDKKGHFSFALRPFMDELHRDETAKVDPKNPPPWVVDLMDLLKQAGHDPVMHQAQDEIFDEQYWEPAFRQALTMGLKLPLSYCVVYDSFVQGSFSRVRRTFTEVPPAKGGEEKAWTSAYVHARKAWLGNHSNETVRNSVYRPEAFIDLMADGNWKLTTPITIRGTTIT